MPLILPSTFLDSDIIWKACQFSLLVDLPLALGIAGEEMAVLGSLRYVIGPKVEASGVDIIRQAYQEFLGTAV